ncbi:hypothetical protein [Chromobacterium sp. LK1]|uniref:hypothetical protein n=1 Tax=Chromobacterium sp. LK1 TaxID=1628193 RepID=UPI0012E25B1E|nr:hypothetical protein [Chromobacterium sp. LK1]
MRALTEIGLTGSVPARIKSVEKAPMIVARRGEPGMLSTERLTGVNRNGGWHQRACAKKGGIRTQIQHKNRSHLCFFRGTARMDCLRQA